jgi:Flp pilus assembly protein TadG
MISSRRRKSQRGGSLIEFTFVGIPLMFVLISIFEASRGMWTYNLLAHAIKEGTRYAIVHGNTYYTLCTANGGSGCTKTVGDVATAVNNAGPGLIPAQVVNFTVSQNGTAIATCATLSACLSNATALTSFDPNNPNSNLISVSAQVQFRSAIALFWTGAGPGMTFPAFNLPASSQDTVVF